MKRINKTLAAGALGTAAMACIGCCASLPLLGSLLAWSGLSVAGAAVGAFTNGWYAGMVALFAAGAAGLIAWQRRKARILARKACGCGPICGPAPRQGMQGSSAVAESSSCQR